MKDVNTVPDGMKEALRAAVIEALREVGVDGFRKTSLFLSNQRQG